MKQILAFVALLALVVTVVVLTISDEDDLQPGEKRFTFWNGADPQSLDPQISTGVPESRIIDMCFEGLVRLEGEHLDIAPGAAASWEISESQLVYTFHLQPAGKWSDGKPVTAQDWVSAWHRIVDPRTASKYAVMLNPVKGATAANKTAIDPAKIDAALAGVGVKAVDEKTLEVTLAHVTPYFLEQLAHHATFCVRTDVVKEHGDSWWTKPETLIGNGPFKMADYRPKKRVKVVPNEHYWAREKVKVDSIVAVPIESTESAWSFYEAGKLDYLTDVPTGEIEKLYDNKTGKFLNPEFRNAPILGVYYYRLNHPPVGAEKGEGHPAMADPRVRRALWMTIDREHIVGNITKGGQFPAYSIVPPVTSRTYRGPKGPGFNPEAAKALLAEAGWKDTDGDGIADKDGVKLEFTILYNTNEAHKQVAESVQADWKKHLGVSVKLFNAEWKTYQELSTSRRYQIARAGWIGDYSDPNTFADMWVTGGENNETGWGDKTYDRLIDLAGRMDAVTTADDLLAEARGFVESMTDDCVEVTTVPKADILAAIDGKAFTARTANALRLVLFWHAERIIAEQAPIVPIYFYMRPLMCKPWVKNLHSNPRDHLNLRDIEIDLEEKSRITGKTW
jgi:oligopeptide transport system substrate-binding protein